MSGWSNFCTLVGHFSKLFEFVGLNWLKTLILVPNSGCSPKKKKKKKSSIGINLRNSYFLPKIRVFSNQGVLQKKKKGLQLELISKIPIFIPKSGCSLRKNKTKGFQLESISEIPIFIPKS